MNPSIRDLKAGHFVATSEFRHAMRNLAGGVSVITVGRGDDISGMTVTSLSSLSVDPPTLIVSVNRQSSSWPLLHRDGVFGVNILAAGQASVAERFSGKDGLKGLARFGVLERRTLLTGAPFLAGVLAAIDCEVEHVIERHSHAIVVGRVLALEGGGGRGALAYWDGQYIDVKASADVAETQVPTAWALRGV
jgi:flavin reductase (DIM6/NTAB) family NADH-FMN oxidoreductase RutF